MRKLLLGALTPVVALLALGLATDPQQAEAVTPQPPPTCSMPGAPDQPGAYGGVSLSPGQMDAVRKILAVAKGRTITRRGATIAVQTAMQESTLDSSRDNGNALGLFQQIAPGPYNAYVGYDPHDSAAAAGGFFTVLLKRAPAYEADPRPNHVIAEVVQASGEGWRYERWQPMAEAITAALFDGSGPPLDCADRSVKGRISVTVVGSQVTLPPEAGLSGVIQAADPRIATAIGAGLSWLGTTYAWGGGNADGPTKGTRDGGVADEHGDYNKVGFDCSGLTLYSYAQAGVKLTRPSASQLTNAAIVVPFADARSGDLLFWGTHHVAMYLGRVNGQLLALEAPKSGDVVKVSKVRTGGDFRNVGARPISGGE